MSANVIHLRDSAYTKCNICLGPETKLERERQMEKNIRYQRLSNLPSKE